MNRNLISIKCVIILAFLLGLNCQTCVQKFPTQTELFLNVYARVATCEEYIWNFPTPTVNVIFLI